MTPPAKPTDTAEPLHFGTKALVESLSERIATGFLVPKPSEPALVIGVFGEWGSGKSTLLNGIDAHFDKRIPDDFKAIDEPKNATRPLSITVPIEFNAWRYERDEHLIVPLLKTAQSTLRKTFEKHRSTRDKANDWAEGVLDLLSDVTLAVGKGLDWEFKLFGALSVKSKTPGEMLEDFEKRRKKRTDDAMTGIDRLSSLYVNFHSYFRALTGRDGKLFAEEMARLGRRPRRWYTPLQRIWYWLRPSPVPPPIKRPQLNLVFLIDDLDRCLPEKTVEMLEVIKLFLEVEGCAFVLAVDEDVVERGILHRYRDYVFQQHNSALNNAQAPASGNHYTAAPITGREYLEKIIHLPIRLGRPSKQLIREFLLQRYPPIFVPEREIVTKLLESVEASAKNDPDVPRTLERVIDSPLLPVFLNLVPSVPRRLVRAVELFVALRDVAQCRGLSSEIQPQFLAVLTILQVCAPELFRYARLTRPQFLDDLRAWGSGVFNTGALIEKLQADLKKVRDESTPNIGSIMEANDKLQLALLVEKGLSARSGFDARQLATLNLPEKIDAAAHLDLWADRGGAQFTPAGELPPLVTPGLRLPEDSLKPFSPALPIPSSSPDASAPPQGPVPAPAPATVEPTRAEEDAITPEPYPEPPRESAVLEDASRFVQGLCAREPAAWGNALARESSALQNRVLDQNTFSLLLRALGDPPFIEAAGTEAVMQWLNLIGPHLSAPQSFVLAQRLARTRISA